MSHLVDNIDITSLLKARDAFELFRQDMITDRDKAGAIQAFEFCYELSLQNMKRVLAQHGIEVASPREAFRQAGRNGLITNVDQWLNFLDKRNLSSHTYNQQNVEDVLSVFNNFSEALDIFISNLERKDDLFR